MHDAVVLEVDPGLEHEPPEIAAQAGTRPDIDAGADDDVADQDGVGMDEGARVDHRDDALERINLGHRRLRIVLTGAGRVDGKGREGQTCLCRPLLTRVAPGHT